MIRVAHLTSVHPRADNRIFYKECRSLAKAGYEVILVVGDGLGDEVVEGVKIVDAGSYNTGNRIKRILLGVNNIFIKGIELNADIYHLHDPELLLIALKLIKQGKKVIYDVHEDVPRQIMAKYWIPRLFRKLISTVFEKYENNISLKLSYIITATPYIYDRFKKINPNTIDVNNFPYLQLFANVHKYANRPKSICYIGGVTKVRGGNEIIDALEFTDTSLHLAGKISPESFKRTLLEKNQWKNVTAYGHVSRDEVLEILNKSMAGMVTLHPVVNYLDALPVKMFEYMAAGLPVIASDFPLWKEIIKENQCGLTVNPLSPKEIADAIEYLYNHPEEAKRMSDNGKKAVKEKYNWEIEEKKLLNIYTSLEC